MVRDTSDVVDVVEKILDANDVPDPEVVLDVEVIEISDTNTQRLGLLLSNYNVQLGAFSPNGNLMSPSSLASATTSTATRPPVQLQQIRYTIDNLVRAFCIKGYGGFVTVPNAPTISARPWPRAKCSPIPRSGSKTRKKPSSSRHQVADHHFQYHQLDSQC